MRKCTGSFCYHLLSSSALYVTVPESTACNISQTGYPLSMGHVYAHACLRACVRAGGRACVPASMLSLVIILVIFTGKNSG